MKSGESQAYAMTYPIPKMYSIAYFIDAIIAVDVQEDGKWLLATCKTHLLLMPTEIEGRASGFTKSLGPEKPRPIKLHLRPEHIAMMGQHCSFTAARFNTGQNHEKSIVSRSIHLSFSSFTFLRVCTQLSSSLCLQLGTFFDHMESLESEERQLILLRD